MGLAFSIQEIRPAMFFTDYHSKKKFLICQNNTVVDTTTGKLFNKYKEQYYPTIKELYSGEGKLIAKRRSKNADLEIYDPMSDNPEVEFIVKNNQVFKELDLLNKCRNESVYLVMDRIVFKKYNPISLNTPSGKKVFPTLYGVYRNPGNTYIEKKENVVDIETGEVTIKTKRIPVPLEAHVTKIILDKEKDMCLYKFFVTRSLL